MLGYFKKDSELVSELSTWYLTDLHQAFINVHKELRESDDRLVIETKTQKVTLLQLEAAIWKVIHRKSGCVGCEVCMYKYIVTSPLAD